MAKTTLRPSIGQLGWATAPYRPCVRPCAAAPTGAYVFGPRVTKVVEHGRAAAIALQNENRLPTVLAPRGVGPRLAEWTMAGNRHYALRIAISGIKSPPAEVRHTELLRRASRPSESLSYPMFGDSGQTRDSPMLRPVLVIGAFRRDPVLILVQRAPQCRRFGIGGQNVA